MAGQSRDIRETRRQATDCVTLSWIVVVLGIATATTLPDLGGSGPVAMIFAGLTANAMFSCKSLWESRRTANARTFLLHTGNLATITCVGIAFGLQLLAQYL